MGIWTAYFLDGPKAGEHLLIPEPLPCLRVAVAQRRSVHPFNPEATPAPCETLAIKVMYHRIEPDYGTIVHYATNDARLHESFFDFVIKHFPLVPYKPVKAFWS